MNYLDGPENVRSRDLPFGQRVESLKVRVLFFSSPVQVFVFKGLFNAERVLVHLPASRLLDPQGVLVGLAALLDPLASKLSILYKIYCFKYT